MTALPSCPKCQSGLTYEDGNLLVCPECAHEWSASAPAPAAAEVDQARVVRDAFGTPLADGGLGHGDQGPQDPARTSGTRASGSHPQLPVPRPPGRQGPMPRAVRRACAVPRESPGAFRPPSMQGPARLPSSTRRDANRSAPAFISRYQTLPCSLATTYRRLGAMPRGPLSRRVADLSRTRLTGRLRHLLRLCKAAPSAAPAFAPSRRRSPFEVHVLEREGDGREGRARDHLRAPAGERRAAHRRSRYTRRGWRGEGSDPAAPR